MRRIVITGASRGLGAAMAGHYAGQGDEVISLSRARAALGRWIGCDLADPTSVGRAARDVGGSVDALIHVAGIWEETAFSPDYDFAARPVAETSEILTVNLLAPILLTQALLPALVAGARVVLIGSSSGLDQIGTPEVAYNASKSGLRGAAQALARACPTLGVTIINPGDLATEEVIAAKASGHMAPGEAVPFADMLRATDFALAMSPEIMFSEINILPRGG